MLTCPPRIFKKEGKPVDEEDRKKCWDELRAKMEKQQKDFAARTPEQRARFLEGACKHLGVKPSTILEWMIRNDKRNK